MSCRCLLGQELCRVAIAGPAHARSYSPTETLPLRSLLPLINKLLDAKSLLRWPFLLKKTRRKGVVASGYRVRLYLTMYPVHLAGPRQQCHTADYSLIEIIVNDIPNRQLLDPFSCSVTCWFPTTDLYIFFSNNIISYWNSFKIAHWRSKCIHIYIHTHAYFTCMNMPQIVEKTSMRKNNSV